MKTWVVTGGAATGKSAFCNAVIALSPGARLASCDDIVHELLATPELASTLAAIFSPKILDAAGVVDRAALRQAAFASEAARLKLEAVVHPRVYQRLVAAQSAAAAEGVQLFVAEIPLYYEAPHAFPADRIILVATGDAAQQRRMMEARGLDDVTARRILAAQIPLRRKLEMAPNIVWNEGSPELLQSQAQLLLQQNDP